jgi:DNA-binding IclR family transcriptional regulator
MTTADRMLAVLALFSTDRPALSVEEVSRELNLSVSTVYRYFRSLSGAGLTEAFVPGRYVLGPAVTHLDRLVRIVDPLITSAAPVMCEIANQLPPSTVILLCRLYKEQVMCVHQEVRGQPARTVSYERGRPLPLFRGSPSKVILAHLSPRRSHRLYLAQRSIGAMTEVQWRETKRQLREIRAAGLATSEGEVDPGVVGISVPLFDLTGSAVGSLSLVLDAEEASHQLCNYARELLVLKGRVVQQRLLDKALQAHERQCV